MSDDNPVAQRQQKPGDRPQQHPTRKTVLQMVRDFLQMPALCVGHGLNSAPFNSGIFHQEFDPPGNRLRFFEFPVDFCGRLPDRCIDGFQLRDSALK